MDTCGATLGTVYYDSVYTVGKKTFSNWYSSGYQGYSSIRDGIIYSMNVIAVRCLMETVTPVSYTHLDVYKRQCYSIPFQTRKVE